MKFIKVVISLLTLFLLLWAQAVSLKYQSKIDYIAADVCMVIIVVFLIETLVKKELK